MFGISKHGFKRKTYDDILQELIKDSKEKFGENINVSSKSIYGMFLRLISWTFASVWQLAEKVYLSGYVRYANGITLDRLASNIGVTRRGKQHSYGIMTLTKEISTAIRIPSGFIVEGVNGQHYRTIQESIFPSYESTFDVGVQSVERGSHTILDELSIAEIVTPVDGILSAQNKNKISGGSDEETDEEFRERYFKSLGATGSSTRSSLESQLRELDGVTDVRVIENDTKSYMGSLPPHFIHVTVLGGSNLDIAYTILGSKAAGIGTFGRLSENILDESGQSYSVNFDKAEFKDVFVKINLNVEDSYSHSDTDIIKENICKSINKLGVGVDVFNSKLIMDLPTLNGVNNIEVYTSFDNYNWEEVKLTMPDDRAGYCKKVIVNVHGL